jgi:hypothetical protein
VAAEKHIFAGPYKSDDDPGNGGDKQNGEEVRSETDELPWQDLLDEFEQNAQKDKDQGKLQGRQKVTRQKPFRSAREGPQCPWKTFLDVFAVGQGDDPGAKEKHEGGVESLPDGLH